MPDPFAGLLKGTPLAPKPKGTPMRNAVKKASNARARALKAANRASSAITLVHKLLKNPSTTNAQLYKAQRNAHLAAVEFAVENYTAAVQNPKSSNKNVAALQKQAHKALSRYNSLFLLRHRSKV